MDKKDSVKRRVDFHLSFFDAMCESIKDLTGITNKKQFIVTFVDNLYTVMDENDFGVDIQYFDLYKNNIEGIEIFKTSTNESTTYEVGQFKRFLSIWAVKAGMPDIEARYYKTVDAMFNQFVIQLTL